MKKQKKGRIGKICGNVVGILILLGVGINILYEVADRCKYGCDAAATLKEPISELVEWIPILVIVAVCSMLLAMTFQYINSSSESNKKSGKKYKGEQNQRNKE